MGPPAQSERPHKGGWGRAEPAPSEARGCPPLLAIGVPGHLGDTCERVEIVNREVR